MNIEVTVTNQGGTTPNFEAEVTDAGQFLADVGCRLQRNEEYAFVWDGDAEKWYLRGVTKAPKGITLTIIDENEDMLADGDTITVTITLSDIWVTEPGQRTKEMYDYAADGVTMHGIPPMLVFVGAEADLDGLTGYQPGAMAATIGFGHMWHLNGEGTWVPVGAAEEEEG